MGRGAVDPLSQGAVGAAVAGSAVGRQRLAVVTVLGLLTGMAADLDVLIRSADDPLLFLDYHRQFTHALLLAPVGAGVCAVVAYPVARRWLTPRGVFVCCLLGYLSHGLLDACTSYGTQLLWPFSEQRVAWNVVSVIDPAFTLPLAVLVVTGVLTRRVGLLRAGLIWVGCYLALGLVQSWRVEAGAERLAAERGHSPERLLVKPSFANLWLWKTVYRHDGFYYVDAIRAAGAVTYFPGERIAALGPAAEVPGAVPGSVQARDLERFRRFSAGYVAGDVGHPLRVIDVRYSMLPDRIDPLWGIELDPGAPESHVRFVTDRQVALAERQRLVQMLLHPGLTLGEAAAQSW